MRHVKSLALILSLFMVSLSAFAGPPTYLVYELPTNASPSWVDLNNHCEVVGRCNELYTTPINYAGEGVLFNLADMVAGNVKLGYLEDPLNSNWQRSSVYDINNAGRMVGQSNYAPSNQNKPVEFLRPAGTGVTAMASFIGASAEAINSNGTRVLIKDLPNAYIFDYTNSLSYSLYNSGAGEIFTDAAMNDAGQVAIIVQVSTNQNMYLCEVPGASLSKTLLPTVSGTAATVNALNDNKVMVGLRMVGGVGYPYAYDAIGDAIRYTSTPGGEFHDINDRGTIVGTRFSAGVFAEMTTNTTITTYNLTDCLAGIFSGYYNVQAAHAINDNGVILAEITGGTSSWALLIPEGLIAALGIQWTSIGMADAGGILIFLPNTTAVGTFTNSYDVSWNAVQWDAVHDGLLEALDASVPTNLALQAWSVGFDGAFSGVAEVTLHYDEARVPGDESVLGIVHYTGAAWETLDGVVDTNDNTITFYTASFSPFLLVTTNAGPATRVMRLEGDLSFGNVDVGANTQRNLTIYNDGNTDLTVSSISYPTGFSGAWSGTIGSGYSQVVAVTFSPVAATAYSGNIVVTSDSTSGSNTLAVSGTGLETRVIRLEGDLDFGDVEVGTNAQQTFTIYNDGSGDLYITTITYPTGFIGDGYGDDLLSSGASQVVAVTFSPVAATSYSGDLTVTSDSTSGSNTLALSGTGIRANTPGTDFDGDGISDLGTYLAPSGAWSILQSGSGSTRTETFGYTGTVPVVGDFDGDGVTDFGCYDAVGLYGQPSGSWYFMASTRGFFTQTFGYGGTVPVVGDFDGDGADDFGCYDAAGLYGQPSGSWYFMASTRGFFTQTFGYVGTVPVVGDFDGDGTDDFGCYDAAGIPGLVNPGSWYLMRSTAGFTTDRFGYSGTVPVVGDFDGDDITDYGCYDAAGIPGLVNPGSWYLKCSTDGFVTKRFGYAGTSPVVGDYDADGVDDYGCFDPNLTRWYIMQSSDGFKIQDFGATGARPLGAPSL